MRRALTIRWRLTLWYGAVLSAIMVGFSVAAYLLMRYHLLAITDATLRGEFAEFEDEVGRTGNLLGLTETLRSRFSRVEGHEFELSTPEGEPLFRQRGRRLDGIAPSPRRAARRHRPDDHQRRSGRTRAGAPGRWDGPRAVGPAPGPCRRQPGPEHSRLRELLIVFLTIGPIALVCTLGGGYWLARKALEPIDRMAATAAEITSNQMDRRLEEAGVGDELGGLARTFNAMIERLQRLLRRGPAIHRRRRPRAANPAGRDADRGRGRPPLAAIARTRRPGARGPDRGDGAADPHSF